MNTAVIALGGNLGQPENNLLEALAIIADLPEIGSLKISSFYKTAPVGYLDQPDFINAVAIIQTSYTPQELLTKLQSIEQQFKRLRPFPNAPRTLDLDIIDYNHEVLATSTLTLPHPHAHERGFVMQPLAEIAPEYIVGIHGTARNIAQTLGNKGISKLDFTFRQPEKLK